MAIVNGTMVEKVGKWYSWKIGTDLWEFRQWPEEAMTCNGKSLTHEARQCGIKLAGDAVIFSKGYHAGVRQGWMDTIEKAMRG